MSTANDWARLILDGVNKLAYSPANSWKQTANYAGLPDPTTVAGETWLVLSGTGIWPVNKPSGWYYSNATSWIYLGAYNPVVTGGNVAVTNFPTPGMTGQCSAVVVPVNGAAQLLLADADRKGFVLTVPDGAIYLGIGFIPTPSLYSFRLTTNSVLEKDFAGMVFAVAEANPKTVYITEIK